MIRLSDFGTHELRGELSHEPGLELVTSGLFGIPQARHSRTQRAEFQPNLLYREVLLIAQKQGTF